MVGTCLLACEGLWVGEVRGRQGNGRVGLGAHLYFDEHWADATMKVGWVVVGWWQVTACPSASCVPGVRTQQHDPQIH